MISIFIFSSFSVQQMRESILYSNPNCYLCSSSVARLCQNSQSSKTWKSGDIFWNSLKQVGILDIWSKYFPTQGEFESQISLSTHSVLNRENIYGNSQFNLPCLLFPKSVECFTHQSSKTCKADINYLSSFGEVGVMDTYIDQLFPKKVAEGQDFLYSHSMLKKKRRIYDVYHSKLLSLFFFRYQKDTIPIRVPRLAIQKPVLWEAPLENLGHST